VDQLPRGRTLLRPKSHDALEARQPWRPQSSEDRQERTDTPSKLARVHGARLHELMRTAHHTEAQSLPGIAYTPRPETTPEAEISALRNVYSFIVKSSQAKEKGRQEQRQR
jgi:hypothetical protein